MKNINCQYGVTLEASASELTQGREGNYFEGGYKRFPFPKS